MKQIFILEREELNDLKRGEPLKIVLGDQVITLQADVPRRPAPGPIIGRRGPNGTVSITAQVAEHLEIHGPASVTEIAKALGVKSGSVSSPLIRGRGKLYKKTGKGPNAVWRAM